MMHFFAAGVDWSIPEADPNTVVKGIMGGVFFLLGLVAVGFIIYSGIKFQLSRGNAGKMVEARNTMLYSIVGLVLAIAAWAIVRFVIGNL
ncbi:MAG: pilin [Candidatus Nomurabacteria bacterium]|jgi:hypothetical protein|nr:pilin [Candidatus Nomurabacteria bacterium]